MRMSKTFVIGIFESGRAIDALALKFDVLGKNESHLHLITMPTPAG